MENEFERKTYVFKLPVSLVDEFRKKYPRLLTRFVIKCIYKALKDKNFFDDVFIGLYPIELM